MEGKLGENGDKEKALYSLYDFVVTTRYPDIPDDVRVEAKRALLDVVGCGIGAQNMKLAEIATNIAETMYGGKGGLLWCGHKEVSILGAALANSLTVDALDIHDSGHNAKGHAGVALVPAALLLAAPLARIPGFEHIEDNEAMPTSLRNPLNGEELLTTLVVGYEVAYRAGETLIARATDYHSSGAWNAIGCAAMWARRLGLTYEETMHAFGIAEYYGPRSPVMRVMDNPTMLKDGSGVGCWAGVTGALLASKGFTGAPADILVPCEQLDIWSDLREKWHLTVYHVYKKHPTCYWAQAAIHGALIVRRKLEESGYSWNQIEEVNVETFPEAYHLFQRVPRNSEEAQYSISFAVASAIVHGSVDVSLDGIKNVESLEMLSRTYVSIHDSFLEQKEHETTVHDNCADVKVTLKDGRKLHSGMTHVEWDIFRGLTKPSNQELEDKFRHLCRTVDADPIYSEKVLRLCTKVDSLTDASILPQTLSQLKVDTVAKERFFESHFLDKEPVSVAENSKSVRNGHYTDNLPTNEGVRIA